jgi:ribosomal protein S12 methylthiotransferase
MKKPSYHIISLGCAKNTVDSSSMAQLLDQAGCCFEEDLQRADYLIVNTCGFIDTARQESIEVLKDLAKRKRKHQLLIVSGCLTQRYGEQILQKVSGIDGILGTRNWNDIVRIIGHLRTSQRTGSSLWQLLCYPTPHCSGSWKYTAYSCSRKNSLHKDC